MQPKTFFITGVPGSGKSAVIHPLKSLLGSCYGIHDFDERGIPDNVDTTWQANELKYWINVGAGNTEKGITTIICGFALPPEHINHHTIKFILLDVSEDELRKRLAKRYAKVENIAELQRMRGISVDESIKENINSITWLQGLCKKAKDKIIETSNLIPERVAEKIAAYIKQETYS